MPTVLKNALTVAALAPGATTVITHGLSNQNVALEPDHVHFSVAGLGFVSQTSTTITVINNDAVAISGQVLVESWHSIERSFPSAALTLPNRPFVTLGGISAPSGFIVISPSGGADDTTLIQTAVNSAIASRRILVMTPGTYPTSARITWSAASGAACFAYGAVLQPSLTWADPTKEVLRIAGGTDGFTLDGLTIDIRQPLRPAANNVAQAVVVTNSKSVVIRHITVKDMGCATGQVSGPALAVAAMDVVGDLAGTNIDAEVGTVAEVWIEDCVFSQTSADATAFGIRVITNFAALRPKANFVHHAERVHITGCSFGGLAGGAGSFYWNQIEHVGGGTRDFWAERNFHRGKCLSAIDCDKGCYRGYVLDNELVDSGKPTILVGDPTTVFAAFIVHGLSAAYTVDDVLVQGNRVKNCTSASVDDLESFFATQYCNRVRFIDNDGQDLNGALHGSGVVVFGNSVDCAFVRNKTNGTLTGLTVDLSQSTFTNLVIDDNEFTCTSTVIACGSAGAVGSETGLKVSNNRGVSTLAGAGIALNVDNHYTRPIIEGNVMTGCLEGYGITSLNGSVRNNTAIAQPTGFHFYGNTQFTAGNDASTCATQQTLTGGAVITGSSNSWNVQQSFRYTCTGAEGADFFVALPATRLNDSYTVVGSKASTAAFFDMRFPDAAAADRTTTQFRVQTSAAVGAGDTIDFLVTDR